MVYIGQYWIQTVRVVHLYTPKRQYLTRMVVRGKPSSVANYCMVEKAYREAFVHKISSIVIKEITKLCSDEVKSILRNKDPSPLLHFAWSQLLDEAKAHAPLFTNLLSKIVKGKEPFRTCTIGFVIAYICQQQCTWY